MEQKPNQKEAMEMLQQMDTLCVQQNLAYYSQHGDVNKTELLLIAGLNPNDADVDDKKKKQFILHNVCIYGTAPIVELLLQYGANINLLDESGETALHKAVENNKADIVKVLIKNGADLNLMTGAKKNALYIAEQKKNSEIVELLKKAGAHQMTDDEIKVHKKRKLVGKISIVIALAGCIWIAQICSTHSSNSVGKFFKLFWRNTYLYQLQQIIFWLWICYCWWRRICIR